MGNLDPVAFDIETDGLSSEAVTTVAGLAHEAGEILLLNTAGRYADTQQLERSLIEESAGEIEVAVVDDEQELLRRLETVVTSRLDEDKHYLTAFNGEVWNGGFDLPFLRTACADHGVEWPFSELAYADMFEAVDRFDTGDNDLVGVYDELIGRGSCDPFDDSGSAVEAFSNGDWEPLLLHNLADIQRTREIAVLAERYVAQKDFRMKSLDPPK